MIIWKLTKKILVNLGYPWVWVGKVIIRLIEIVFAKGKRIRGRKWRNWTRKTSWIYGILTIIMLVAAIGVLSVYELFLRDLPNVNQIYNPPKLSSQIYDRNGKLLYKFYEGENRSWVPLEKIPQSLIWATISIEDKEFFKHHGLSLRGIVSAMWYNIRNSESESKLRGGSTITQQLVKNVFFSREKSLQRKLKEAVLTIQVESTLNKNEILERYFNQVPYGGETYGAQEASLKYFGKNVWEINMEEAAYLAGLPAAPTSYSPGEGEIDYAKMRMGRVVEEMVNAGYIDENKGKELMAKTILIKKNTSKIVAPHFVFYIKNILENRFGYKNFQRMGLKILTSLDLETQRMAEEIVKDEVVRAKNLRITNGAALISGVENGDILAMVGSKDYWAADIDGKYNVTTALRQPGSSIKPINYLLALQKGKTLLTIIDDSPITYEIKGQKPYTPHNYNGKFMGKVPLKTALASSLNIPSVKLLEENGIGNMIDLAEKMGITTWGDRGRFGLSLALGAGEVKMIDMVQAYSIFANLGDKVTVNPIMSIENYLGENVYKKEMEKDNIVNPGEAYLIDRALSDDNARAPIFGINSKLVIPGKTVAVKTGTTNNLKDNWCIGWTPTYLVATWVGNNDGSLMSWVASGVSGATPIWNRIMKEILKDKKDEDWVIPDNVNKVNICGKNEYFLKGTEGQVKCPEITPTPTPGV